MCLCPSDGANAALWAVTRGERRRRADALNTRHCTSRWALLERAKNFLTAKNSQKPSKLR